MDANIKRTIMLDNYESPYNKGLLNKEGYYIIINFEAKPELIAELERNYRITDEVLKFIVVKVEE